MGVAGMEGAGETRDTRVFPQFSWLARRSNIHAVIPMFATARAVHPATP